MKSRIYGTLALAMFLVVGMLAPASAGSHGEPGGPAVGEDGKIFVCKYVGQPGSENERLKRGKNPIHVDASTELRGANLEGTGVDVEDLQFGDSWTDAQGRSAIANANGTCVGEVEPDPDPKERTRAIEGDWVDGKFECDDTTVTQTRTITTIKEKSTDGGETWTEISRSTGSEARIRDLTSNEITKCPPPPDNGDNGNGETPDPEPEIAVVHEAVCATEDTYNLTLTFANDGDADGTLFVNILEAQTEIDVDAGDSVTKSFPSIPAGIAAEVFFSRDDFFFVDDGGVDYSDCIEEVTPEPEPEPGPEPDEQEPDPIVVVEGTPATETLPVTGSTTVWLTLLALLMLAGGTTILVRRSTRE